MNSSVIATPPNRIDFTQIDAQKTKPMFEGITFDSRPAAMRHLLLADEISSHYAASGAVGLDIGSKYGLLRRILAGRNIDLQRLDVVDREDKDGLHLGDGRHLPFDDGKFDFAVLAHVLAHVEDLPQLMSEIRRVLKPAGRLIILQNNRYGWWKYWGYYIKGNDRAFHYRTFSKWRIEDFLRENGFDVQTMKSPYYFYLHSKFSDFCYNFDRSHGSKIPRWMATQWLITTGRAETVPASPKPIKLPVLLRPFVEAFAFVHAVAMKAFELVVRRFGRSA